MLIVVAESAKWWGIDAGAWIQAIAIFLGIVVSAGIAVWTVRAGDRRAREQHKVVLLKESRDILRASLLSREVAVQKVLVLTPVATALLRDDGPSDPDFASPVLAELRKISADLQVDVGFIRTVVENASLLGIRETTAFGILMVYFGLVSGIELLSWELDGRSVDRKTVAKMAKELVIQESRTEEVLRDARLLVDSQYRRLIGDDSAPFDGGGTFIKLGDDWVLGPAYARAPGQAARGEQQPQ